MLTLKPLLDMPFKYHILAGTVLRILLIIYADFHDENSDLKYTDIDYKVFTGAARHVVKGGSPYMRHTYRYSPLIAYLMIPNIILHKDLGKLLFSIFDILISIAIKVFVKHHLDYKNKEKAEKVAVYCSLFWLYNPFSLVISTRGSADSIPCFFIIISILFLHTDILKGLLKYALSGILLGISIHLRLYPLVFSFPMYLSIGDYKINRNTGIKEGFLALLPNKKQIILALSCIITLAVVTYAMYALYGYEFLFETYIYHLFRKDTKHNFSIFFYYLYLTMDQLSFDIVKTISQIFEGIILFVVSLAFGCDPKTLPLALFCQAFVLVAYNTVMTSQYFIWFLSLLPLIVQHMNMTLTKTLLLVIIWASTQGGWLFYAYLVEFQGKEAFLFLWLKSVVFFFANIYVLAQIIKNYTQDYGFGQIDLKDKNK